MLPCTTKRRVTTNLKTISKQKCHKIKCHGTLTTKELKKHSSRVVGGVDTGSQVERMHGKVTDQWGEVGLAEGKLKIQKL